MGLCRSCSQVVEGGRGRREEEVGGGRRREEGWQTELADARMAPNTELVTRWAGELLSHVTSSSSLSSVVTRMIRQAISSI